jgi:hypothetical protein
LSQGAASLNLMATFSVRNGFQAPRSVFQLAELDAPTRMRLWNVLALVRRAYQTRSHGLLITFTEAVWAGHFEKALDEFPPDGRVWALVKDSILRSELNEVFDVLEFFSKALNLGDASVSSYRQQINQTFEKYLVGFRFMDTEIVPLDSETDTNAVSAALSDTNKLPAARHHLGRALELLSDRESPDYPNSIKESISAVESVARRVTSAGTLGEAIRGLSKSGVDVHPALEKAWSAMYGWTSDQGGIRHGAQDVADADQELAKYMLVSSSAFVSYLIEAGRKAGKL